MKLTDFSLIFIGITLPIMIIVYINVSFTIKAQEQEMYYKKIIDLAVQDASNQMKEVENEDPEIDYGYSGKSDKKISINAQVGIDTFLNSLYNNFDIKGNIAAEHYLQLFIPAIAVIDYNGVQISSIESYKEDENNVTNHTLKPKKYYTFTYSLMSKGGNKYSLVEGVMPGAVSVHTIDFSMDDYIVHRGKINSTKEDIPSKGFFIGDTQNDETTGTNMNASLIAGTTSNAIDYDTGNTLIKAVSDTLTSIRKDVIVKTIVDEMAYAVNANNSYARAQGITYSFNFPATTTEEMYDVVENVGIMAFVQGLSIGNRYLNTRTYGMSKLDLATKYYFTLPNDTSKFKMNLYHNNLKCPEYRVSLNGAVTPRYVLTKQQASSAKATYYTNGANLLIQGFYPCPICNP